MLDTLLIECLQDHVSRAVRRVTGAANGGFAEIPRVSAKAALSYATVGRATEREAHVLQLVDHLNGLSAQHLDAILVSEIIAALNGVEHVPLPAVAFRVDIAQGSSDPPLGGAGVRASGIELADDGRLEVLMFGQVAGGCQTGTAPAHDDRVAFVKLDPRSHT